MRPTTQQIDAPKPPGKGIILESAKGYSAPTGAPKVISYAPKTYNDVATETFGPLEKYVAANDNVSRRDWNKNPPRVGDWMQTWSARKFWPLDPHAEEVFIEDIAHSLSMQCRYAGHCRRFYSVAEHSVLMARWLLPNHGPEIALWGLMHDASEAYLVDVPRPVKPYLAGYKDAESKVMAAVCQRFGLAKEMPAIVHDADNRIIGDELENMTPMAWHARYNEPLGVSLRYWSPEKAEVEFLATFDALMSARSGRVG